LPRPDSSTRSPGPQAGLKSRTALGRVATDGSLCARNASALRARLTNQHVALKRVQEGFQHGFGGPIAPFPFKRQTQTAGFVRISPACDTHCHKSLRSHAHGDVQPEGDWSPHPSGKCRRRRVGRGDCRIAAGRQTGESRAEQITAALVSLGPGIHLGNKRVASFAFSERKALNLAGLERVRGMVKGHQARQRSGGTHLEQRLKFPSEV